MRLPRRLFNKSEYSFDELRENKKALKRSSGVVGSPGITMPIMPNVSDRKPKRINNSFRYLLDDFKI